MRSTFIFIAAIFCVAFHGTAQTIFFEDFTSVTTPALPTGWRNTFTAAPGTTPEGWVTITRTADAFFGGSVPCSQYVECTEYYHIGNDPAYLTSPVFSLAGATAPYLSFDFLFNGTHYYYGGLGYFETAYVLFSADSGATWTNIDTLPVGGFWDSRIVNLAAYADSPKCMVGFRYCDSAGSLVGWLLTNVRVYDAYAVDLKLTSVSPAPGTQHFVSTATGTALGGVVTNLGTDSLTHFTATYQGGTAAPVTSTFSGLSIPPATTYTFTCTSTYVPASMDSLPVKMWVTATGDGDHSNDTLTTSVTGVSHFPVKTPVAEEATATWCNACPSAIIAMDGEESTVHELMSFIGVHCSISTTDPMTVGGYGSWIQSLIPSYPYLVFDRRYKEYVSNISYLFSEHHLDFGYADITIGSTISGSSVNVPVTVHPATNMHGVYKLAMVLTEDKVHSDVTPSNWDQANLYSGGASGPMANAEYDFVALPNPVPATEMYYNQVARSISPSVSGGSYFPATLTGGTSYAHTFTAPLAPGWNVNNMHAIVMLIDSATGYILNSANKWLVPHSPLSVPAGGAGRVANLAVYPNPVTSVITISADDRITSVAISNLLGQEMYAHSYDAETVQVDVAALPAGVYLIKINGIEVRKFVKQ